MKFKDAQSVDTVCQEVWRADQPRARNRARINRLLNGEQPYTDQEARDNKIDTNVNFLEATNIAHGGRSMFNKAFVDLEEFFSVKVNVGPVHLRQEWGSAITKTINRYLKDSFEYSELQEQKFAQVVLHGAAVSVWPKLNSVIPKFTGIGDILFPSGTLRDMSNLSNFQIWREWTAAELFQMTQGSVNDGWNMRMVSDLLKRKKDEVMESSSIDNWKFPERLAEDYKANLGYYASDATPKIRAWDFFFLDDEDTANPKWCRRIILASDSTGNQPSNASDFLYESKKSYGSRWQDIFAVQYADGNNVAPFLYHSRRSLGFLLYATAHISNRLRCRSFDAAFRETLTLFRNVGDGDRERLELIDLHDHGVIPEGLNMVTAAERYQVNNQFLQAMQQQTRQLLSENSAHYTNDIAGNSNSGQEKTATQILSETQAANALVGAMLGRAYRFEEFQDREICRRLCDVNNSHPESVAFRLLMVAQGVPPEVLNVAMWDIRRNRQIGNGNRVMALAMADRLMSIRPNLDPEAQRSVDRLYVQATTDDQGVAELLVPMSEREISPTDQTASLAWGSLIDGKPVVLGQTVNRVEYIDRLMGTLGLELEQIEKTGGAPDERRIMGLANVIDHIGQQVQTIAEDPAMNNRVKQYEVVLAQATAQVEAYASKAAEARGEESAQGDPKDRAKIQSMLITAQSKAKIAETNAALKQQQKEIAFQNEQIRKKKTLDADIAAKDATTAAEITRTNTKAALEPKEQPATV